MKKNFILLTIILFIALSLLACEKNGHEDKEIENREEIEEIEENIQA